MNRTYAGADRLRLACGTLRERRALHITAANEEVARPWQTRVGVSGVRHWSAQLDLPSVVPQRSQEMGQAASRVDPGRQHKRAQRLSFGVQPIIDVSTQAVVQHMLLPHGTSPCRDVTLLTLAAAIVSSGEPVAIRLPNLSVGDPLVLTQLDGCLLALDLDPTRLLVEVDDTALTGVGSQRCRFIQQLHDIGCKLALGDSGNVTAAFLHLPFDYLTLDATLVRQLPASEGLIAAIVERAGAYALGTIAHGVESDEALDSLRCRGVELAIGDQIAPCVPLDRFDPHWGGRSWLA